MISSALVWKSSFYFFEAVLIFAGLLSVYRESQEVIWDHSAEACVISDSASLAPGKHHQGDYRSYPRVRTYFMMVKFNFSPLWACVMCVMMFDGWEWPSMMSDPRGGPCYLYTDIWLIDWLKIINNSQQHFSTTLKIPWYTFREWRDTIIVMLPFRIFMSFPCHFWPSSRVLDLFSQSESRSVSHWPIRGGGWACHDQERGWVTVVVSRRGELIKLFTLSPHSQAGSGSWLLIGPWDSVLASDW